jgi:hypothetical protein
LNPVVAVLARLFARRSSDSIRDRKPLAAAIVRLSIAERPLTEFASKWPKLHFENFSRKYIRSGDM